jgi:hypothetical protein
MAARFQVDWLDNPEFKDWIKEISSDSHKARCSVCHCSFTLSNMGRRALRSHAKGQEHQRRIKALKQSFSIKCFTNTTAVPLKNAGVNQPAVEENRVAYPAAPGFSVPTSASIPHALPDCIPSPSTPRGLQSFIIKDNVTKAEILWCLQTVVTHKSARMSEKDVALFAKLFPDSEIAKKMQLKRSKIGYSIVYGIAPFFKTQLNKDISQCKYFSVGFDESLNKVSQKTQMDVNIRFWSDDCDTVCTRYYTSSFLNRTTANDIRHNFKIALADLDLSAMIQISMDGPNMNHNFFRDLKAEMDEKEDFPVLLNMGSCGLHTLHGAFKTGVKATNWNLIKFFRCIYNLFKDVPARRGLYVQYSGYNIFPLKFCSVRWLSNGDVAQRAIDMIPHLKKFKDGVENDKINITCMSFKTVCTFVEDPLLEAKLTFFISLIALVEPFLKEYQTDVPLVPFLHGSLESIAINVMGRFVKESVLKENTAIHKVDLKKKQNLLSASEIDLGYATRSALKKRQKEKVSDKNILEFRENCLLCLKTFLSKILECSPLLFPLTKAVTCFDPAVAANSKISKKKIMSLLTILNEHKWIDGVFADKAQREYENVCSWSHVNEKLKRFKRQDCRVDAFWRDLLKGEENCDCIISIMKLVMSLSHGNANVERGFSVNSECLVENLKEQTLISQRIVYDSIASTVKDVNSYEISKSLIHSFKNAHALLKEDVKKRQQEESEKETFETEKKRKKMEAKELEKKIYQIQEEAKKEINAIVEQIESLKK